jgi:hypothetical protein
LVVDVVLPFDLLVVVVTTEVEVEVTAEVAVVVVGCDVFDDGPVETLVVTVDVGTTASCGGVGCACSMAPGIDGGGAAVDCGNTGPRPGIVNRGTQGARVRLATKRAK